MARQRIVFLICGDRNWSDFELMKKALGKMVVPGPQGDIIMHGNATGADAEGGMYARFEGCMEVSVPYPKQFPGKSGGPMRNQMMLDIGRGLTSLGYGFRVVAFHDDFDNSRGTKDMVTRAKRHGIRVTKVRHGKTA